MFPGVAKLGNICFGRKICGHPCHFLAEGGNIIIRRKKFLISSLALANYLSFGHGMVVLGC